LELRAGVLSAEEISEIDKASIQLLSEVGVAIASEKALQLLDAAGARVDHTSGIVKIPEDIVRRSVSWATQTPVQLFDRDGTSLVRLEGKRTHNICGFDAIYTLDLETGERRPSTKRDSGDFAKLADALPNICGVGNEVIPQDVPGRSAELHAVEATLNNTSKHCLFAPSDGEVARAALEMVRIACGRRDLSSKPPVTLQASSTSPLRWQKKALETLMEAASSGVPLNILPQPIAGLTAPITLGGVLLLQNIETLSGLVITQLLRRGAPVIYGYCPTTLDMREANPALSAPEGAMMRIASAEMAKHYGLVSLSSDNTDAHVHDEQAAWEKAAMYLAIYLARTDISLDMGVFSGGLIASYEQLVIDGEILGYVERLARGMRVNQQTLAVDLVRKVGHGGQFLKEPHTLNQFKSEHWIPEISCRAAFGRWIHKGGHDLVQSAKEKARRILREHHPQELSPSTRAELTRIVEEFKAKSQT